ncbi:hypothetical protein QBC41DRAFT_369366 [Cercophora samala]|uniref:Uncharacterized protein n=1 Tax=Cercophora samala TaxID=330535 RepID=A0AA39YKP0_9PEZI|nr:hypothetical protein QBC41DRAFT_369366 [Cercophora samala]
MHLFYFIFVTLSATLAYADFDLYDGYVKGWQDDFPTSTWFVFASPPNCDDVFSSLTQSYAEMDDVSGDHTGVRCEGAGCGSPDRSSDPYNVDVLEMHFANNPLWHFTIYKDRGSPYKMYGLDGKTYGECIPFPGHSFDCLDWVIARSASRMFRCYTEVSAAEIEGGER